MDSIRIRTAALSLCAVAAAPSHALADLRDQIIYHFMPISWRDSDQDTFRYGDFDGMTASIPYLNDLGVTGVWMNPIFPSPAYHGYQHGPADQINPRFGTEPEFLNFVSQARAAGLDTYLDLVVYQVSHDSPYFQGTFGNPSSVYDDWLAFENGSNTQYWGSQYPTWNGDTVGVINWDLRNPDARNLVNGWSSRWLDPNNDGDTSDGIAGYRLDHVWEFYCCGPDGWGYNLDSFWLPWRAALESVNPGVVTFAEQADWGSLGRELLPAHDATFTKPFEFAARDALRNENAGALYAATQTAWDSLQSEPGKTYIATIGNHDVDRLASSIGADQPGAEGRLKAAAAVLLTQPFPPNIYYGDELGMLGIKQDYGSDANDIPMREPMPWNAAGGFPESNYWAQNSQAFNNRYDQPNDGVSVAEQQGVAGSLYETYKELIAARRASTALRRGSYAGVPTTIGGVWAFVRDYDGDEEPGQPAQTVLVAVNLTGANHFCELDLSGATIPGGSTTPTDLLGGGAISPITDANKDGYILQIPAYGHVIVEVDLDYSPIPSDTEYDGLDVKDGFGPGDLLATQVNPTGFGNNQSELNQLFARHTDEITGGGLRLGITGNMELNGNGLVMLIDRDPGATTGANLLNMGGFDPPPFEPLALDGAEFDTEFWPDVMIYFNAPNGTMYVDRFELSADGVVEKTYIGSRTLGVGDGSLSQGEVQSRAKIALDNSNVDGVTSSSAVQAATAEHGFEILLPYDELGIADPLCGELSIMTVVIGRNDGFMSNQVLPPVPNGTPNLAYAPDFSQLSGDQYAIVPLRAPADVNTTNSNPGDAGYGQPDGEVDGADLSYFVENWLGQQAAVADVNTTNTNPGEAGYGSPDGQVDGADLSYFVEAWLAGCT